MTDYEKNWDAAMGGHLNYGSIADSGGGEGGGKEGPVAAAVPPKGYKPSTSEQRKNWNQFLDFLEQKGVGGSKDLDARDKSLGLKYLQEYNKAHPDQAVSADFIPVVQYESYLIRKKGEFPGLSSDQAKYAFSGLAPAYKSRPISGVDSWLGSATSRQYYPTFQRLSANAKKDFGTSFEDYLAGVDLATVNKGSADQSLPPGAHQ